MEMKNLMNPQEEEEDDEEDFVPKKGGSSHRVGDGKSGDQKVNTPRSKHSATEQRRRSKINDRFQILRDLVPQNDQKRDKASFLLEVIQYIQFLQEKVNRYEGPHQGWNQEPVKLTPWKNGHAPAECMISRSGPGPELLFSGKFDDNVSPAMVTSIPNPIVSDLHAGSAYKAIDQGPGLSGKDPQLPIPINTGMLTSVPRGGGFAQPFQRPMFDAEKNAFLPQVQVSQNRPCAEYPIATDTLTEQDPTIEGGTISIAGIYSQGLLNNLTQALQSSGVDLSQASISVQIDLGKQSINRIAACTAKDQEDLFGNRAMENSGIGSSGEESDQAHKRLKRE